MSGTRRPDGASRRWWPAAAQSNAPVVAHDAGARLTTPASIPAHPVMQAAAAMDAMDLQSGTTCLHWTQATIMADIRPTALLPQSQPSPTPAPAPAVPALIAAAAFAQRAAAASPAAPPLHAAVFLTAASRDMLLLLVPPLHHIVQAQHMVVLKQPRGKDLMDLPIGAEVAMQVIGAAADHLVQAVLVLPPTWLPCPDSAGPHILLSRSSDTAEGYAGQLVLEGVAGVNTCYHQLPEPFMVYGRLGVQTNTQVVYSLQELLQGAASNDQPSAAAAPAPPAPTQASSPWAGAVPTASLPPQLQPGPQAQQQQQQQLQQQQQELAQAAGSTWVPRQAVPAKNDFPVLLAPNPVTAAAATPTAAPAASPSAYSGGKISLKDFIRSDHGSKGAPAGSGMGKAGGKAAPRDGNGQNARISSGGGATDGAPTGGATPGRVCWLEELGLGDYVEVALLVAPGSGADSDHGQAVGEGFIAEILTDEPYQPQGVLVRLHDNTMGYAARLVAKQGPAAAEAAKAHARRMREQQQGGSSGGGSIDGIFSVQQPRDKAQSGQSPLPRTSSHDSVPARLGGSSDGRGAPAAGSAPDGQDNAALAAWQPYVEQYGEALTSAVLEDCGGDIEQAARTLEEQAELLGAGCLEALDELVARAVGYAAASASSRLAAEQEQDQQRRAAQQAARASAAAARAAQEPPSPAPAQQVRLLTQRGPPRGHAALGLQAPSSMQGPVPKAAPGKVYTRTADDDLEPATGALHRSNWRAAALQGRAAVRRQEEAAAAAAQPAPVPGAGAFPPLKLLRRPDSLANTAAQAGQHIRSAEALRALLPGYSSQAVVSALSQAGGDVNRAADLLLASGPPTETAVAQAAVSRGVMADWDSSSSDDDDEDEVQQPAPGQPQDTSAAAAVVGGAASERSANVSQLLQAFEGLDSSLAEFLLKQCGGDLERTSRYIMHEVLGRPMQEPAAAATTAPASSSTPSKAVTPSRGPSFARATGSGVASSSGKAAAAVPSPARAAPAAAAHSHAKGRQQSTWEVVPPKQKPRRREVQYVVGDDTLETDTARRSARLQADQERRVAQVYYDTRNVLFQRAAAAYSAGDGRLAAELSRKGKEMTQLAHKHRQLANEAAHRASNTSIRNQYVMDLHHMYVEEALGMLRHTMATLEALNSHTAGMEVKVITGMGHHSVNNVPVIKNTVLQWLKETGRRHYVDPANEGVVCVQLGPK